METIASVKALEDCIGVAGLPVRMKIIDHLDETAKQWIAASPFLFLGVGGTDGPTATAAGGPAGFATVTADGAVAIPLGALDDLAGLAVGVGAGLLFLAPGVGETLRANGRIARLDETRVEIAVEECFVHCAKALIRSDFWTASDHPPDDPAAFIDASRFLALVTMDASGQVDVSPKGDPAGLLARMRDRRVTLAERPGNRLAFGYHNMIEQPKVAALAIVPGNGRTAVLRGRAALTADEDARSAFVVDGKTPILATVIETDSLALRPSGAMERAGLWRGLAAAGIDPAGVLVAHIKLNKAQGVEATMLRLVVKRDLVHGGLQSNYKTDLY